MWSPFEKLFTGYSGDDLQAESDNLDAKLAQQNQAALERGAINQAQYDETSANIERGRINAAGEIQGAFNEGLQEGYDNTTGIIKSTLAAPFKFSWKIIPWQLLAAGGVALFFYAGGGQYLKGILPRKLK